MSGILYIVATPIGNLNDISKRAESTLASVDLILAEDTRKTSILLNHFSIKNNITSYHQHSLESKKDMILNTLIQGQNIALVTDGGTPGIADPGNELIEYLVSNLPDVKILPIPGPSAAIAALSVCGFPANQFIFLGFMPKKGRTKLFDWLKNSQTTFVFFESPRRIVKTLQSLIELFSADTQVFVGRELTKLHELHYRGALKEVKEKLEKENLKGEIVVVVSPGRIELPFKV